jgi:hypothetical protein
VDPHDWRHAGRLKPAGEIGDRLEIEGTVLVIDRAVIEAGCFHDPRDAARGELLEPGSERRSTFTHGPVYAVFFHEAPTTSRAWFSRLPAQTSGRVAVLRRAAASEQLAFLIGHASLHWTRMQIELRY